MLNEILVSPRNVGPVAVAATEREDIMAEQMKKEGKQLTEKICAYVECQEHAWPRSTAGFCLYHAPENGEDEKAARKVWDHARESVSRPGMCSFTGWHFPRDPAGMGFLGSTVEATVDFGDATFHGEALFGPVTFKAQAWFRKVTFEGRAFFVGSTFDNNALFADAVFQRDADFSRARFKDEVWFIAATLKRTGVFLQTAFNGNVSFQDADFQGNVRFDGAVFNAHADFTGVTLSPGRDIVVERPSRLPAIRASTPFREVEQGETLYRLAKQAAQQRGDYRRAGEYHYAEQCAVESGRRRACRWRPCKRDFWRRRNTRKIVSSILELLFVRGLFGYGEMPHRALIVGLLVVALWSLFFWTGAGIIPGGSAYTNYDPSFCKCVYFSAVTFTTLGYGDFEPKPGFFRFLAGAEAFLGAALMALFIVGLARKYTR